LRTAVCVGVNEIVLHFERDRAVRAFDILGASFDAPRWVADFARMDGFADSLAIGRFFTKLHGPRPFRGILICW